LAELIFPALKRYKEIYGNYLIAQNFVVPNDDDLWDKRYHNLTLGMIALNIRSGGNWLSKHEELLSIGFTLDAYNELRWKSQILPAFKRYREIYGDLYITILFVVPYDKDWPSDTHGIKLGEISFAIRQYSEWKDKHDELREIGFIFSNLREYKWREKILPSLKVFKSIYNHFKVPNNFIVPEKQPWPVLARGLNLGNVVRSINQGHWKYKRNDMIEIGILQI